MAHLTGLPPVLSSRDGSESPNPADLEVVAGDLWAMSWDRSYLGLVCVAAVKQGYILGWPVTLPDEPVFAPALVVNHTPLRTPLFLWPTRETGLGMHLLHWPLGRLINPQSIQRIAWAMEDGEDPGIPFAPGSAADAANTEADEAMVERWASLCFQTWPEAGARYLSETKIKNAGGTASRVADCLGLSAVDLRPLWTGVQPASEEQLAEVARVLGVEASALLDDDPMGEAVERLAAPLFKEPLLGLASQVGITEGVARDRARSQYALAARDDSLEVSDTRLMDAIRRAAEAND